MADDQPFAAQRALSSEDALSILSKQWSDGGAA